MQEGEIRDIELDLELNVTGGQPVAGSNLTYPVTGRSSVSVGGGGHARNSFSGTECHRMPVLSGSKVPRADGFPKDAEGWSYRFGSLAPGGENFARALSAFVLQVSYSRSLLSLCWVSILGRF
jgi:hypothetical protein